MTGRVAPPKLDRHENYRDSVHVDDLKRKRKRDNDNTKDLSSACIGTCCKFPGHHVWDCPTLQDLKYDNRPPPSYEGKVCHDFGAHFTTLCPCDVGHWSLSNRRREAERPQKAPNFRESSEFVQFRKIKRLRRSFLKHDNEKPDSGSSDCTSPQSRAESSPSSRRSYWPATGDVQSGPCPTPDKGPHSKTPHGHKKRRCLRVDDWEYAQVDTNVVLNAYGMASSVPPALLTPTFLEPSVVHDRVACLQARLRADAFLDKLSDELSHSLGTHQENHREPQHISNDTVGDGLVCFTGGFPIQTERPSGKSPIRLLNGKVPQKKRPVAFDLWN